MLWKLQQKLNFFLLPTEIDGNDLTTQTSMRMHVNSWTPGGILHNRDFTIIIYVIPTGLWNLAAGGEGKQNLLRKLRRGEGGNGCKVRIHLWALK